MRSVVPLTSEQQGWVTSALPAVDALARRTGRRFPHLSLEDFISVGSEALVESARRFDPSRGVPFEAFAYKHVKGELLRVGTEEAFGRLHVRIRKRLSAAGDLSGPPELTLEEALVDTKELARTRAVDWLRAEAAGMLVAALGEMAATPDPETPESLSLRKQAQQELESALATLDDDERHFVARHYREDASLDELAAEFGVVKRTINRLHAKTKVKLARALQKRGVTASV